MGTKTKIEWTEATWNPVRGCSIVSEGCRNCYAMRMAHRSNRPGGAYEGLTRIGAHGPTWTGDVRFIDSLLEYPLRLKNPHRIFVNSMSDLFHEGVNDHEIDDIFVVMALAPQHTFQILTKRPARMRGYLSEPGRRGEIISAVSREVFECWTKKSMPKGPTRDAKWEDDGSGERNVMRVKEFPWPLPNVWLGVSVENQKTADERIPLLMKTPAAVRWISVEPLLGPIDLTRLRPPSVTWMDCLEGREHFGLGVASGGPRLDWVVVGGESGPGARPMHPDWVRSIRDQCAAAGVPFFFKQWGEFKPLGSVFKGNDVMFPYATALADERKSIAIDGRGAIYWNEGDEPPVPQNATDAYVMSRVGKKAAGNHLDGRQHLEYPA